MCRASPVYMGRCAELQVHVTEAMAITAEQRELIARLEQDLSTIQSIQRPDAEGAAEKIPEPIKEATALFYGEQGQPPPPREWGAGERGTGDRIPKNTPLPQRRAGPYPSSTAATLNAPGHPNDPLKLIQSCMALERRQSLWVLSLDPKAAGPGFKSSLPNSLRVLLLHQGPKPLEPHGFRVLTSMHRAMGNRALGHPGPCSELSALPAYPFRFTNLLSTRQAVASAPRPGPEIPKSWAMLPNAPLGALPPAVIPSHPLIPPRTCGTSGSLPEGQVDSLLSIISSQRERFRARNQELEAESRLAQHTIQALQGELDSLRADNIKLFEKIKFLQSYPSRGSSSDDTEQRYSSQYEERLDPFSSFSKRERQRKYLSLSPWDKATLSMGRLVLSNKMARTISFFYTLFLHCLVFLVLYKLAWSESVERDCTATCAKKFADHLHKFHENDNGAAAGDLWQ
ncbi:Protein CASP [Heterocephalus glaber]|uniref:Protein CASP n=1 Tax=Heterocephalus glaber TaxID=10181 RepID=G5AXB1_HETGA|nr:Protein CASP [Heterocephalus glaber]